MRPGPGRAGPGTKTRSAAKSEKNWKSKKKLDRLLQTGPAWPGRARAWPGRAHILASEAQIYRICFIFWPRSLKYRPPSLRSGGWKVEKWESGGKWYGCRSPPGGANPGQFLLAPFFSLCGGPKVKEILFLTSMQIGTMLGSISFTRVAVQYQITHLR